MSLKSKAPSGVQNLRRLLRDELRQAFAVGDEVQRLVRDEGLTVKQIASEVGASRQRLSELRRTAEMFGSTERDAAIDFHYFTIAGRAARRLGLDGPRVLQDVTKRDFRSTRQATAYLAKKVRQKEARRARTKPPAVVRPGLLNRCHRSDFRNIVTKLDDATVKLVVADPPYGAYGRLADGALPKNPAAQRACDQRSDVDVRAAITDLLKLSLPKVMGDGALVLFRPGAVTDPIWLLEAIGDHGWSCERVVTWDKGKVKLGRGDEAYTVGTERMLVLARQGGRLINHDGSDRSDIVRVPPVNPRSQRAHQHHAFEKPVELCRRLISKHTHAGELVFEPFGGTGSASVASIELGRRWICTETNPTNHQFAEDRLGNAVTEHQPAKLSRLAS